MAAVSSEVYTAIGQQGHWFIQDDFHILVEALQESEGVSVLEVVVNSIQVEVAGDSRISEYISVSGVIYQEIPENFIIGYNSIFTSGIDAAVVVIVVNRVTGDGGVVYSGSYAILL